MIRSALLARNQLKYNPFVAGCPGHFWDGSSSLKLRNGRKPVLVLNPHRLYSAGGSGGSKPAGFMASATGPMGMKDHSPSQKGTAATEVRAPPTILGKLEKMENLETSVNFKDEREDNPICSDKQEKHEKREKQEKQSDTQKKAKEAQEAAAQKFQEIVASLPSKQQTEKYFFRAVAFAYDLTYLTGTWMVNFIEQNIVRNEKVQHYWKRFHEKMEQAKKD